MTDDLSRYVYLIDRVLALRVENEHLKREIGWAEQRVKNAYENGKRDGLLVKQEDAVDEEPKR